MFPAELTDPQTGKYKAPWMENFQEYEPEFFAKFQEFQEAAKDHKEIDRKTEELIAVAIHATTRWPSPYINVHIHQAFDAGATIQEVFETIKIAARVGASTVYNHGLTAVGNTIRERQKAEAPTPRRRS